MDHFTESFRVRIRPTQVLDATHEPAYIPRFIQDRLQEALTDIPVVLIHGPRQSGKTT